VEKDNSQLAESSSEIRFSKEDIDIFGIRCEDVFDLWVDLSGLEGMTNYVHMIGSGLMIYYLQEWRNLY
jgi:hypothetical protein